MMTAMEKLKAKLAAQKAEHERPVAVPTTKEKVAQKMKVPVKEVVELKKGDDDGGAASTKAVMGRPKKEKVMTAAERSRAYRARVRARSS